VIVCQDDVVEDLWSRAVSLLGGDQRVARAAAVELTACYAQPHRRYHTGEHIQAVLRDSALLADDLHLPVVECAVLTLAACTHDVVYQGQPGDDERASAAWARDWLVRAGVDEAQVVRVEALVLATLAHTAPSGDLTALALLDADLAILGAEQAVYDRYRAAVREEYAAFDDEAWRTGRTAVLSGLLARVPLYATAAARERWETVAKANIAGELASLE
jgi:predicted metal-dependent HD superfamily phosphohydrolase